MGGMMGGMGGMGGYGAMAQMVMQFLATIGQAISSGRYDEASMDMANEFANLLLGASSETKDLAEGLDFATVDIDPMTLAMAYANPNANPALAAATFSLLQQLGAPTAGVLAEGSPLARALNKAGTMNLSRRAFDKITSKLQAQALPERPKGGKRLREIAGLSGFESLEDLYAAQNAYEQQASAMERVAERMANEIQAGRTSAMRGISQLQQDFPLPTATTLDELEQRVIAQRKAQIDRNYDLAVEAALEQANAKGINPARALADLEAGQGGRQAQYYNIEQSDALERAIALASGRQGLATSALGTLASSLAGPVQQGLQAGSIYSQGVQALGDQALAQALATNRIMAEQAFYNANQMTAEELARLELQLSALGLKTQGGMMDVRGEWIGDTKTARMMDTITSAYGGGSTGQTSPMMGWS
jgi:hypothetical protein